MANFNILEETKRVLEKNHKVGDGYDYTAPAVPKYPHQWLWDSCFAAIILAEIDPERAKREIRTLLSGQRVDGFLPSILIWENRWLEKIPPASLLFDGWRSRLTQLPVVAQAIEKIYEATGDDKFLTEVLPKAEKFYLWLARERDFDSDGLVAIIHPWEATDDSPAFDKILLGETEMRPSPLRVYWQFYKLLWDLRKGKRRFEVESVMFNCLFAQGLRILSMWKTEFEKKADRVEEAILKNCFDTETEFFFDNGGAKVKTIGGLFPLILDQVPKKILDGLVKRYLLDPEEFWLPYPVPFVAKSEKEFNPENNVLLWRGPTWVNTNWLLIKGLEKHGSTNVAKKLKEKTMEMVEKSGLWEMYNPLTGKGEGQKDYTWSGLAVDLVKLG